MANFLMPPGAQVGAYDVDNSLAPGSVWRARIPRLRSLEIALYGGAGLWVRSNNPGVVPQWQANQERMSGDLRILPLFGRSAGVSMIETGAGGTVWVSLQAEVVDRKVLHIALQPPHMVLNGTYGSAACTDPYDLLYKEYIPESGPNNTPPPTAQEIIDKVKARLPLNHLVFNCHGAPGYLWIGGGFRQTDAGLFSQLNGRVKVVWIRGCSCAGSAVGQQFCADIAQYSKSHVVAPIMHTPQYRKLPPSTLEYEQNMPRVNAPGGGLVSWLDFCCMGQRLGFSFP
jgi:hypothetical protein